MTDLTAAKKAPIDEDAYRRLLMDSAAETAARSGKQMMTDETRTWGRLRTAVLDELGRQPATAPEIGASLGRGTCAIISVLNRLRADGLVARMGTAVAPDGRRLNVWERIDV